MKNYKDSENLEIFPWNDNFETNIEKIDEQHKILVSLVNKLANALTEEKVYHVEEAFNELAKYTEFHFKSEEAIWKKHFKDDTFLKEHQLTHNSFLPTVLELKEKNKSAPYYKTLEDILLFLIRWLAFHIIDEDKRLAYIIKFMQEGKTLAEATDKTDKVMGGSMKKLMDTVLTMYDNLSLKAIDLIRERKARILAEEKLKEINKELERLSNTDQLTHLYNRRHFDEVFECESKRARREKKYFSIISFDIDCFKQLNDTYGHIEGDKALKEVSICLRESCRRPADFVFRIGGEEFCIISINDNRDDAYNLAKIIQSNVNDLKIENKNSFVKDYLTISMGVISTIPKENESRDNLMTIVDKRLYTAKRNGRDRIVYTS